MKKLSRRQFGDPILQKKARRLKKTEIIAPKLQELIADMRFTLRSQKLGVGLAAPQVGHSIALAVVSIHPTPHRPKVKPFDLVIINPTITKKKGTTRLLWEGCISSGREQASVFAKVSRYPAIELSYQNETGVRQTAHLKGLPAHIAQHEVDHLKGILFTERADPKSYMTYEEYMQRVRKTPIQAKV